MDAESYDELLNLVMPMIVKQNTTMREAISPNARLSVTLRFLATGNSFGDMKFLTRTSPQTISLIVFETCQAITRCLQEQQIIKVRVYNSNTLYSKTVDSNKGATLHTKSNVQIKRTFLQKLLSDNFNAFIYIYISLRELIIKIIETRIIIIKIIETRISIHFLSFLGHKIP